MWANVVAGCCSQEMYGQATTGLKQSMVEFSNGVGEAMGVDYGYTVTAPLAASLEGTRFIRLFLDQILGTVVFLLVLMGVLAIYALVLGDVEAKTYEYGMLRVLGLKHRCVGGCRPPVAPNGLPLPPTLPCCRPPAFLRACASACAVFTAAVRSVPCPDSCPCPRSVCCRGVPPPDPWHGGSVFAQHPGRLAGPAHPYILLAGHHFGAVSRVFAELGGGGGVEEPGRH